MIEILLLNAIDTMPGGGFIKMESKTGLDSTFSVYFPSIPQRMV